MLIKKVDFHEKRKFFRVKTDIPAAVFPFFQSEDAEEKGMIFYADIVNLSGAGAKLVSEEPIPASVNVLVRFTLGKTELSIVCKTVRRLEEPKNNSLMVAFSYPQTTPINIINQRKWMENKIVKYVFQQQVRPAAGKTQKNRRPTYHTC